LENPPKGNIMILQILWKKITLSSSEKRWGEDDLLKIVWIRFFALDLRWLLVTEERGKEEEEMIKKYLKMMKMTDADYFLLDA